LRKKKKKLGSQTRNIFRSKQQPKRGGKKG